MRQEMKKVFMFIVCSAVCRRSALFFLAVYRAGSEDLRSSGRAGFRGDQHLGGSAEGPRRSNRLPAAAGLRLPSERVRGEDGPRRRSETGRRRRQDHHPAQRHPGSHRVPHLRHQAQNLTAGTQIISTTDGRF